MDEAIKNLIQWILGLGRISGLAGYLAGYPVTFNMQPDTRYYNYPVTWYPADFLRRISDYPAGYPVFCQISNVGQISGRNRISSIKNQPDIRYPAQP